MAHLPNPCQDLIGDQNGMGHIQWNKDNGDGGKGSGGWGGLGSLKEGKIGLIMRMGVG